MKLKEPLTGKSSSRNKPFNQILRIFKPKGSNATKFSPQDVVKFPPVGVLLFGLTLYESHEIWTAAPRGNEIRASEENLWFFVVWTLTSLNISWNFRKLTFSKNRHFRKTTWSCLIRSKTMAGTCGPDQNEVQTTADIEQIPLERAI